MPSEHLLPRKDEYTRVYITVYPRVHNSIHACTLPRSKYILSRARLCVYSLGIMTRIFSDRLRLPGIWNNTPEDPKVGVRERDHASALWNISSQNYIVRIIGYLCVGSKELGMRVKLRTNSWGRHQGCLPLVFYSSRCTCHLRGNRRYACQEITICGTPRALASSSDFLLSTPALWRHNHPRYQYQYTLSCISDTKVMNWELITADEGDFSSVCNLLCIKCE